MPGEWHLSPRTVGASAGEVSMVQKSLCPILPGSQGFFVAGITNRRNLLALRMFPSPAGPEASDVSIWNNCIPDYHEGGGRSGYHMADSDSALDVWIPEDADAGIPVPRSATGSPGAYN